MAIQDTIQDRATAINTSWHKTTDSVLETAKLCADADNKLRPVEKNKLFKELDFNKATFSKLVKIGSQQHLKDVKRFLPPNYTVVYEIAKLSENDLKLAIKEGVIISDMTRGDLDAWISARAGGSKETDNDRVIATLKVPPDFDRDKEGELQQALDELKAQFGIAVQRPRDLDVDALTRAARKVDDDIRKGARLHIRKLKAAKLAARRHLTPTIRRSLWNYDDEEIEIKSDATWERVQGVLDKVGAGDQFQRLLDQALRIQGVSETTVREHRKVNHEEAMKELEEIIAQARDAKHLRGGVLAKYKSSDFSDFK